MKGIPFITHYLEKQNDEDIDELIKASPDIREFVNYI